MFDLNKARKFRPQGKECIFMLLILFHKYIYINKRLLVEARECTLRQAVGVDISAKNIFSYK